MLICRAGLAIVVLLIAASARVQAQLAPSPVDSAHAGIHRTLRAFYYHLAHRDWEALTASVLAAKVVASRPAPEALVLAAQKRRAHPTASPSSATTPPSCASTADRVDQAVITLEGAWAEVSVPRCTAAVAGLDEFRLVNFETRWRIVYIELFQDPINVSADR